MLRVIMMTWLTPTISNGPAAVGTITRQSFCRLVQPVMSAKDWISSGTSSSASLVARHHGR